MTDVVPDVAPAEGPAVPEPSAPPNVVILPSGERVTLRPHVSIPLGVAAQQALRGGSEEIVSGLLAEVYLHFGIESWTFRTETGMPYAITPENIEHLLPFSDGGMEVAEAASRLYAEEVVSPLLKRIAKLLPTGPTVGSTPPIPNSGASSPTPSRRSSPTSSEAGRPSEAPVP